VKVLVDTCIWSLALRRSSAVRSGPEGALVAALEEALRDGRAAIIGPIRQEILSGIRDQAQFEKIRKTLQPLEDEALTTSDFEQAAKLFNLRRSHGVQCGPIDMLICAVVVRTRWAIMSSDEGLLRCVKVLQTCGLIG
jgi:predicted nucleic acid-binding protein